MDEVFVLWHVHEFDEGQEDAKLIGIYRTRQDAEAAIKRARAKPGFKDTPQGFEICPYNLNQDHWSEGYTTV